MAEEPKKDNEKKKIDLSAALGKGEENVLDEDILLSEEELLGTAPSGKGGVTPVKATGASGTKIPPAAAKFHIPEVVKEKYPNLIPLILETESMDDEEREYWFQILPIMTDEQVVKFREILVSEKEQLAKLDEEYEAELKKINEKHLEEWQEFDIKQKKEEIEKAEKAEEKEEAPLEEELLKKLQEL